MNETIPEKVNLKIKVKSKFNYGGRGTAIDIRDSELILVEKGTTEREFHLPPGLYEVSAFLGDGKRASQIVEVLSSNETELKFEPDLDYQPAPPEEDSQFKTIDNLEQIDISGARLLDTEADFTVYPAENYWIVQHRDAMRKVSVITFEKNGSRIQASLPISEGHHYSVTCHVKLSIDSQHAPVQINISQSRSIAFGLESMLRSGQIMKAGEVASNALQALIEKYTDPTGALLAALILYKTGQLDEWNKRYLINLTKHHGWLPDCKIILALYLASTKHSEDALNLACEASKQRILLTENFSLLLDLLRYWPDATHNEQRNEALKRLAKIAPSVSWNSMYLTTTAPGG
ncbi:hypothetical protein SB725_08540 [Pseudomonas sp. SIMBA_041]|uniref:hypothetical protein n=1 Tax=Pseudomonas sp. SIMBA_041 TaxID=3085782 RepID=UPI003979764B